MRPLRMHGQDLRTIDDKLVFLSLIIAIITLPLELIGFITPGWYYGEYTVKGLDKRVLRGLWFTIDCTEGECETYANADDDIRKFKFNHIFLIDILMHVVAYREYGNSDRLDYNIELSLLFFQI